MSSKLYFLQYKIPKQSLLFNCVLIISIVVLTNAAIPKDFRICKRNDPNIASCIKESIMSLREKLARGFPEVNIPGIEPLVIPVLNLQNVNINFTDLAIHGGSTYEITDINVDIEKNRFAVIYKFKELNFDGKYSLDMQVLRLPLKSSGPMHGTFKGFQMTIKMQGKKMKKNGHTHLVFRPMELKLYQDKTAIKLENLFNGQADLQSVANDLINENNEVLTKEILPALETTLAERFTIIANQITSQFTYDELFPLN